MVYTKELPSSKKSYLISRITPEDWVDEDEGRKYFEEKPTQPFEEKETVKLNSKAITELPKKLKGLIREINKSKNILDLKVNEEDEKSDKYNSETWIRTIRFISDFANTLSSETEDTIDIPKIYDGPDGSIDILWKKSNYRLLINIPEDSKEPISLYGDDFKLNKVKSTIPPQETYRRLIFHLLHSLMRCGQ